jgi:hypothetical protein
VKSWKLLGLAGLAGVAATGAVLARAERQRAAVTPEQVRERLHVRYAAARAGLSPGEDAPPPPRARRRRWWTRRSRAA